MRAKIFISGQTHGNFTLLNNLFYSEKKDGMFNSFHLYYSSVKEAKEEIKKAYKSIKNELTPDQYSVVSKGKDNTYLSYDASNARVLKETKAGFVDC